MAGFVKDLGDEFAAAASFSGNQDRRIREGSLLNKFLQRLNLWAGSQNPLRS